jgi:hypothetical protein
MGITFETIAPKTTGAIDPNQADGTAAAGAGEDGKNAKVQRIPRWRDPRYADDSK